MARIRSIKPEFFLHEDLGRLSPIHRLVYIGLWCHADREGRLQYRPQQLKIQICPYDYIDFEALISDLISANFLQFYQVDENAFLGIPSFPQHQRPHIKEAASKLPPPPDLTTEKIKRKSARKFPVLTPVEHRESTVQAPTLTVSSTLGREGKKRKDKDKNTKTCTGNSGAGTVQAPTQVSAFEEIKIEEKNLSDFTLAKNAAINSFAQKRSPAQYQFQDGRDGKALSNLIEFAKKHQQSTGEPWLSEFISRWETALEARFPRCSYLYELSRNWNHFSKHSQVATPLNSKSPIAAEAIDRSVFATIGEAEI